MKKVFIIFVLLFVLCNKSFAESYYFKGCQITDKLLLNYTINIKKNTIDVELKKDDGQIQSLSHDIKKIEEKKITSKKIKVSENENYYNQYFLNVDSKSVKTSIPLSFNKLRKYSNLFEKSVSIEISDR